MAGDPVPCGRDVSPGWTGLPEAPGPVAAGHGANSATGWSPAWFGHGNAPGQVDAVMAGEGQEHRHNAGKRALVRELRPIAAVTTP